LGFEKEDSCFVGGNDGWAGTVGHGCTIDAVVLINDECILVTRDTGREELACRISLDHAGGALKVCIDGTRENGGGYRGKVSLSVTGLTGGRGYHV
jgi:tetrahydrodipicolinate N-succinyltransferase